MTADLVGFLRARLDEDAEAAEGVAEHLASGGRRGFAVDDLPGPICRHIFRHTPARVLAEVEAKRRIIEWAAMDLARPGTAGDDSAYAIYALAAVYADHPDYKASWKL